MKASAVSKDNKISINEKLGIIDGYETEDLLYVLREIEEVPRKFEDEVVRAVVVKLYKKGVKCI